LSFTIDEDVDDVEDVDIDDVDVDVDDVDVNVDAIYT